MEGEPGNVSKLFACVQNASKSNPGALSLISFAYCSAGGDASGMWDIEASKTTEETIKSLVVMATSNGLCPSCSSLYVQRLRSLQR